MVSPLRLWQHPQPKSLWPALGGLSILAHVGVLGLSLPYALELMQPANSSPAIASIPIELVEAGSKTDVSETNFSETGFAEELTEELVEEFIRPIQTPEPSYSQQVTSALAGEETARSSQQDTASSNKTAVENAVASEDPPASVAQSPAADNEDSEENQVEQKDDATEDASPNSDSSVEDSVEDSASSPIDEASREEPFQKDVQQSDSEELPAVPSSGDPLPAPGETPPSNVVQSALLKIISASEVPEEQRRDLGKVPPSVKENVSNEVELSPIPERCPPLSFSQRQWTYRVAVNADGSVRSANVWNGGIGREMNEEERAIACLIENAGFEFEPALFEGDPILDDNLLLTIDLIETL